jgi:hypothetical protein
MIYDHLKKQKIRIMFIRDVVAIILSKKMENKKEYLLKITIILKNAF